MLLRHEILPALPSVYADSTGHRWVAFTKGWVMHSFKVFAVFSMSGRLSKQTGELPVIWLALAFLWRYCNDI